MINKLINLLNATHSQYHAIENIKNELLNNGFIELKEEEKWILNSNSKYFVIRGQTSIIGFKLPSYISEDYHYQAVASHSDSPTFKLKPTAINSNGHYTKLNIEPYGGMIYSSWLDKPLSIAGRVIIEDNNKVVSLLMDIDKDLLVIPNAAIHMNRDINSGFIYNPQVDLAPIVGLDEEFTFNNLLEIDDDKNIVGFDLFLYNRTKASFLGKNDSLFGSEKIDNLECAYMSMFSFIDSENSDNTISIYACFDNEEVGSKSESGADSTFLSDTLKRINISLGNTEEIYYASISKSMFVSADNAHAVHPNHPEYTDGDNCAFINKGVVIKYNSNLAYTSNGLTASLMKECGKLSNVPTQVFANRNDKRGGSTLGHLSQAHVSIKSVDIGLPQLAMHSSYEVAGVEDANYLYNLLKYYYSHQIIFNDDGFEIK